MQIDIPYIEEYISDGERRVLRWSTGLVQGFYSKKYFDPYFRIERKKHVEPINADWVQKHFETWKEAEAWYLKGDKC